MSLDIKDLKTLNSIHSVLNLGKITIYPKIGIKKTCKLIINRTDLQEILLPLFLKNNIYFLTNTRREQYYKVLHILKNDIKFFAKIPVNIPVLNQLPTSKEEYLSLSFFKNWVVGFTIAEGSFLVKSNFDACFQLRQRTHQMLFESFNLLFKTTRKIGLDRNLYHLYSVSSKKDIQNVIIFFSFSDLHPLLGQKLSQYENWLIKLKKSKRYNNLKFP